MKGKRKGTSFYIWDQAYV